jgi:hypothetical protein
MDKDDEDKVYKDKKILAGPTNAVFNDENVI